MNPIRTALRVLAIAGAAAALAGCVTVFPKADPVGLYRFGASFTPTAQRSAGPVLGVYKIPTVFTRASAGDRILTITNGEAAYISTARWVTPASVLFDESVARAFEAGSGNARLIGRSEIAKADLVLRLEVRSFETLYVNGPKSAPEVLVQVHGALNNGANRSLAGDQVFEARVKASGNRVSSIVAAYDTANAKVIGDIIAWVDAAGAGLAK